MREVLARARERLGASGRRTILFLDEIHRFNKAQQDALLPGVEEGLVDADRRDDREPVLRGELGAALARRSSTSSSRTRRSSCAEVVRRGAAALGVDARPRCEELIARRAGGDARNALEHPRAVGRRRRAPTAGSSRRGTSTTPRASGRWSYDKGGDAHYDFISAWIKSTRAGDVQASVYYLAAMLEGGEDARFIARRMIVLASEDIGNADPQALLVAVAAAQAVEHVGLPEARLNLAQAAVYLARAPKSNASYVAIGSGDRRRARARPPAARPTRCARPRIRARRSSAAARATSIRTTTRPASRSTACPTSCKGTRVLRAVRERRGAGGRALGRRRRRNDAG